MPTRPKFTFDSRTNRFRASSGRFLPSSTIRGWIDRTLDRHTQAVADLTEQLRNREITLGAWEQAMRAELKQIHLYSGMAALGGKGQLTQSDFGRIGARLKREYQHLSNFSDQIESGRQLLDGRLTARARAYAQAGRATYETTRQQDFASRGFTEIRSILHPADHCGDCLAEAAKSWQPLGAMVPIGSRRCLANCRCTSQLRNPFTGEVAA